MTEGFGHLRQLRKFLFGISLEETTFARRGFRGGEVGPRRRLEQIGNIFLKGYHAALEEDSRESLALRLNAVEAEYRGFAFEGAGMGLALLDHVAPFRGNRLQAFLEGPGGAHVYMVHVGAGWALARLPWLRCRVERSLARLDPLLRWLTMDGYGFHEGYFHWRRLVETRAIPDGLAGYASRAFSQGLGRSLWFVHGADVDRIPRTIAAFPPSRHADLWAGVGLACAYAGGLERQCLEALLIKAGPDAPALAQGAAFAAKARQRADNPAAHTDIACQVLCGLSADAAAYLCDVALKDLPPDGAEPAYEVWRQRIQAQLAELRG